MLLMLTGKTPSGKNDMKILPDGVLFAYGCTTTWHTAVLLPIVSLISALPSRKA